MLPEEVWRMPKLGTFNLHASLLPQYRGAAPINWAIINGEKRTGVTTFMIDKNIDTGGIILREECLIEDSDNAGTLHDKLMALGSNLVCDTAELIIQHNVELRVQRSFVQGSEELKPAPKLTRELCRIDWTKPSETGERVQLKVFDCSLSSRSGEGLKPGELASDGKSYLTVGTADGAVDITDLQLAGKKRMDVGAFLLGFRNPASWHCDEE